MIAAALSCGQVVQPSPPTTTTLPPFGTISGVVTLEGYSDFSGVSVSLEGSSLSTTTEGDGRFTINAVPAGTYTVEVSKSDFESSNQSGVSVNNTVNFYLISTTPPPPPF